MSRFKVWAIAIILMFLLLFMLQCMGGKGIV